MSAIRNAVPRRPHKERSQEKSRARYGLLEKHKDYSKRARDFNIKKARLRVLRQKATDRNPDEFHFAMMSSRTQNGIKVADRGNKPLSDAVVKLLKTQDAGYLRTMLNKVRKEREKIEEEILVESKGSGLKTLKNTSGDQKGKHTVFVDDESVQKIFSPEEWFQTDEEGLAKAYNRPKKNTTDSAENLNSAASPVKKSQRERDAESAAWKAKRAMEKKHERLQNTRLATFEAVKSREAQLSRAEEELAAQRAKMHNNVGGINKNGIKFRPRERKR